MRNIIFDLGGVIIDLSVERTVEEFSKLSGLTPGQIRERYAAHTEFNAYEKGMISDDEFRKAVMRIFSFETTRDEFDKAWNAMLLDLPAAKLGLLEKLSGQYSLTVLSNTNNIHLQYVDAVMLPGVSSRNSLNDYFHFHYYSHLVGKRKPEPEIFLQVLSESNFVPGETLFLDDNIANVEAARNSGINAQLIKYPEQVFEIFEKW